VEWTIVFLGSVQLRGSPGVWPFGFLGLRVGKPVEREGSLRQTHSRHTPNPISSNSSSLGAPALSFAGPSDTSGVRAKRVFAGGMGPQTTVTISRQPKILDNSNSQIGFVSQKGQTPGLRTSRSTLAFFEGRTPSSWVPSGHDPLVASLRERQSFAVRSGLAGGYFSGFASNSTTQYEAGEIHVPAACTVYEANRRISTTAGSPEAESLSRLPANWR
jgi:hypothetical protein